ncbi:hypothetical protein ATO13_21926 [Stappia sp. 22II-S9-Z10]|nr:hypothetical protein ATO13_21926 [Stappia sp. 22II-S9-Z10]
MNVTDAQMLLARAGYYAGAIDGDAGPKTMAGAQTLLIRRSDEVAGNWHAWPEKRRLVAAGQLVLKHAGYEPGVIDGLSGPNTGAALERFRTYVSLGSEPEPWRAENDPDEEGAILFTSQVWPRQNAVTAFYGQAGGPQCTAGKVNVPFRLKIAWNKTQQVSRFSCHEKVAQPMERVFQRIADAYSQADISRHGFDLFGGCYNYRKMRGGSSLSMHSWGIAIDLDPERNQLKWGKDRAYFARPECAEFLRCWKSESFVSLGAARDYDWMHFQAARL